MPFLIGYIGIEKLTKFFHQRWRTSVDPRKILTQHLGYVGFAKMERVAARHSTKDVNVLLDLLKLRSVAGILELGEQRLERSLA